MSIYLSSGQYGIEEWQRKKAEAPRITGIRGASAMKRCLAAAGAGTRAGTTAAASAVIAASVAAAANQQDGNDNPPAAVSTEETVIIAHTETSCEVVDRQTSVSFHSMRKGGIGV